MCGWRLVAELTTLKLRRVGLPLDVNLWWLFKHQTSSNRRVICSFIFEPFKAERREEKVKLGASSEAVKREHNSNS